MSHPYLDTCPDFSSTDYDDVHTDAVAGQQITPDALIAELAAFCTLNRKARQTAWDFQAKAATNLETVRALAEKAQTDAAL